MPQQPTIVFHDRSKDPADSKDKLITLWNSYCYANSSGSGVSIFEWKPRCHGMGDIISISRGYAIDSSFASGGTSLSDISGNTTIGFGFTHNELFGASIDGNLKVVKQLVENNKNCINDKVSIGSEWTALHGAVVYNQLEVVEYLLQQGADFGIKDKSGNSPLTMATILEYKNCVSLMKKLIIYESYLAQHEEELKAENIRVEEKYESCASYIKSFD